MSQFDGDQNDWSRSGSELQDGENPENAAGVTSCLHDLTPLIEVKVSSRAALCTSLTDESTETFWESGDEDR